MKQNNEYTELKNIVELYTGRKLKELQIIPDPNNPDFSALRAEFIDNNVVYFIYHNYLGTNRDSLEEVEFTEWPPTSNPNNMSNLQNMLITIS